MDINLSKEAKEEIATKLQMYMQDELDIEMGQFDALFLLDFVLKESSPSIYNQGLYDAKAAMEKRIDSISEAIYELEK